MKATWNGTLIAESDDTVVVDGNHYFPMGAIQAGALEESSTTSVCPWKGTASYYHVVADGQWNEDAAWVYPDALPKAKELEGRVDTSDEWIVQRTGIRERRIAADDQITSSISVLAAKQALEHAKMAPEEIDLVICATVGHRAWA